MFLALGNSLRSPHNATIYDKLTPPTRRFVHRSISGLASGIVSAATGDDSRGSGPREAGVGMYDGQGNVGDATLQQQQMAMQQQQQMDEQRMQQEMAARDQAELFGGDIVGQTSEVKTVAEPQMHPNEVLMQQAQQAQGGGGGGGGWEG